MVSYKDQNIQQSADCYTSEEKKDACVTAELFQVLSATILVLWTLLTAMHGGQLFVLISGILTKYWVSAFRRFSARVHTSKQPAVPTLASSQSLYQLSAACCMLQYMSKRESTWVNPQTSVHFNSIKMEMHNSILIMRVRDSLQQMYKASLFSGMTSQKCVFIPGINSKWLNKSYCLELRNNGTESCSGQGYPTWPSRWVTWACIRWLCHSSIWAYTAVWRILVVINFK